MFAIAPHAGEKRVPIDLKEESTQQKTRSRLRGDDNLCMVYYCGHTGFLGIGASVGQSLFFYRTLRDALSAFCADTENMLSSLPLKRSNIYNYAMNIINKQYGLMLWGEPLTTMHHCLMDICQPELQNGTV